MFQSPRCFHASLTRHYHPRPHAKLTSFLFRIFNNIFTHLIFSPVFFSRALSTHPSPTIPDVFTPSPGLSLSLVFFSHGLSHNQVRLTHIPLFSLCCHV